MITIFETKPNIRVLKDYIDNDEMTFDNPVQRGYVWNNKQRSRFIYSIIKGGPIPPLYANKKGKIFDIIDGKQRGLTIYSFILDKFHLAKLPLMECDNGETADISGKKFSELNQYLQDRIMSFNGLNLFYGVNLSEQEEREMYIDLNSGKPLSAAEITKAKTISNKELAKLINHSLFKCFLNQDAIIAQKSLTYVNQSIFILDETKDKCLLNAKMVQSLSQEAVSSDVILLIDNIYNLFENIFKILLSNKSQNKAVLAKIKKVSHFGAVLPVLNYAVEHHIDPERVVEWLIYFYKNTPLGSTSIDSIYNETLGDGVNEAVKVKQRLYATLNSFTSYLSSKN